MENYYERKQRLADIFKDTADNFSKYDFKKLANESDSFTEDDEISFESKQFNTEIAVENKDTFDKAKEMGEDCAVLNMASFKNPGGGVIWGASAQEECLCRRSNLYMILRSFVYPLPMVSTIYSPTVTIFKDHDYNYCEPYTCSVLSAGMLKLSEEANGIFTEEQVDIVKRKIKNLFRTALHFEKRKLVLGAWGCGAFRCSPEIMSKLFKEIIFSDEIIGQFDKICFAILDPKGRNFKAFNSVFS